MRAGYLAPPQGPIYRPGRDSASAEGACSGGVTGKLGSGQILMGFDRGGENTASIACFMCHLNACFLHLPCTLCHATAYAPALMMTNTLA